MSGKGMELSIVKPLEASNMLNWPTSWALWVLWLRAII